MDQVIELTLEREFSLRSFSDQVQRMSHEQAQEFLIMHYKHVMVRETAYQAILKHDWKLD